MTLAYFSKGLVQPPVSMEPNNEGLEADFPSQLGDFSGVYQKSEEGDQHSQRAMFLESHSSQNCRQPFGICLNLSGVFVF